MRLLTDAGGKIDPKGALSRVKQGLAASASGGYRRDGCSAIARTQVGFPQQMGRTHKMRAPKACSADGVIHRGVPLPGRKDEAMSIAITRSVGGFFHEVVGEAVKTQQVDATDEAMSYLVALLTEFAHPDPVMGDAFDRPLAFLLDEAFRTTGAERFQKLRTLGDGVLYITGFFGDHIENRG